MDEQAFCPRRHAVADVYDSTRTMPLRMACGLRIRSSDTDEQVATTPRTSLPRLLRIAALVGVPAVDLDARLAAAGEVLVANLDVLDDAIALGQIDLPALLALLEHVLE